MTELNGQCLCGAITFKLTSKPLAVRVCWCQDCQHISANGSVNMLVKSKSLAISGTLSEYKKIANSGNEVIRQFCPGCGVHLFAQSSGRPGFSIVRTGNLDNPASIKPTMNIWTSSAPDWACMDPDLEQVEQQPV